MITFIFKKSIFSINEKSVSSQSGIQNLAWDLSIIRILAEIPSFAQEKTWCQTIATVMSHEPVQWMTFVTEWEHEISSSNSLV